jgi:hypothetical protein
MMHNTPEEELPYGTNTLMLSFDQLQSAKMFWCRKSTARDILLALHTLIPMGSCPIFGFFGTLIVVGGLTISFF